MNIKLFYIKNEYFPDILELLGNISPERAESLTESHPSLPGIYSAYYLLAFALKKHFDINSIPHIERTPLGKPYFPDYPQIFFSISHTKTHALCALSDAPIGADIETIRPISRKLLCRISLPEEAKYFSAGYLDFFRLWTLKESYIKFCSGTGLSSYRDIMFSVENNNIRLADHSESFQSFTCIPDCAAAVCSERIADILIPEEVFF